MFEHFSFYCILDIMDYLGLVSGLDAAVFGEMPIYLFLKLNLM